MPGLSDERTTVESVRALITDDLPTLLRPQKAISGRPSGGNDAEDNAPAKKDSLSRLLSPINALIEGGMSEKRGGRENPR